MSKITPYHRKRDFTKTGEPAGANAARARPAAEEWRLFVVQKHAARRLHYDFRLELDGTLLSWAVPKGPSLDPTEKRLAVQVEDHPVEYADFEGVIPPGQYGAGAVVVWDRGEWRCEGDPRAGLRKGHLKFELRGAKLRGRWTLIGMARGDDDKPNWLLVKERDDEARPDSEVHITAQARSVVSDRAIEEVAGAADRVWESNRPTEAAKKKAQPRAAKTVKTAEAKSVAAGMIDGAGLTGARRAPQPDFVKPQLATLVNPPPAGDAWLHEIKFDGYRIEVVIRDGAARLFTRNGNDWTEKFPAIAEAVRELPIRDAILDGELVSVRPDGVSDFQNLQNAIKSGRGAGLRLYLFDVLHCGGWDLCRAPQIERKDLLRRLMESRTGTRAGRPSAALQYSDHLRGAGPDVFANACERRLEGIICKRADGPYESRRGRAWLKVKCVRREEFVVGGWTDPAGAREKFGALLLGYYEGDRFVYCGRVGTGFNERTLAEIHGRLAPLRRATPAFDNPPTGAEARRAHWTEPRLVAEVEYIEMTNEGSLRHPSFKGLREDKPAQQVRLERPVAPPKPEPPAPRAPRSAGESAGAPSVVAGVPLTNPGRVLYPEQGITKLDLARYYESVAGWIEPHAAHRPLTLLRCPQGQRRTCFFQKHIADTVPDGIHGVTIREASGEGVYLVAENLKGIVGLAQLGVLEIHVWGSREDDLERPDMMIFDLDPDPEVAWAGVVSAAFDLRARLADLGLCSFAKTTGGKGLHVVAPLTRRAGWDEVKEFSRRVALAMVADEPARFVANMSKARRKGKIYVDYVRNSRGATSISAYSTRARDGAPVAAPLDWDELNEGLRPDAFNIRNMPARLAELKADPWAEFFKTRQSITAAMKKKMGM